MQPSSPVRIEYIRPGKEITYYDEDLVAQDEFGFRTHIVLSEEIVQHLSAALQHQGSIEAEQQAVTIAKTYFFTEPFDLLEFRTQEGALLGYYSDIGEPVLRLGPDQFQMTDLYLDLWLFPDGRLLELDWDEFEEAIQKQVITTAQAELARTTMRRLVHEVAEGLYPTRYLNHFAPLP